MRIALFITCLTDTLFPDTGKAVVTLLERLGHQVEFPDSQTCCGQMHFNSGYRRESLPLARGFAASFGGYDAIVSPSASCTAMVREYHGQLADEAGDAGLARAVAEIAPRVYDLSTLLADVLGLTDVGAYFPRRVTYQLLNQALANSGLPLLGTEIPMARAQDETMSCDLFIVLGSSLVVYPAAGFPQIAKRKGAKLVILNRDPTDQDDDADVVIHAEIGPTMSRAIGVN